MIPKIIHYCWFGGKPKSKLVKKCIASWREYCPDYEFFEWNEENFDIGMNAYTRMCFETGKWAYLSDYVRLWAVHQKGGIYFDTDVELIKCPDFLLNDTSFIGYETMIALNTGLGFGSEPGGIAVKTMLREYDELLDGQHGVAACPGLNTCALKKLGLIPNGQYQEHPWGSVYPAEYFNPLESSTGRLRLTPNTVSIHWYMGSCLTLQQRLRSRITRPFHWLFGEKCFTFIKGKERAL